MSKKYFFLCLLAFYILIIIPGGVHLIANTSWIDLSDKSNIGAAVGGITTPIIGIGTIIITFLAFYIQYKFNIEQSSRIDTETEERKSDKEKSKLEAKRNYFDKKFYQFLEIHNKNIESIYVQTRAEKIYGRESFDKIIDELHITIGLLNAYKNEINLHSSIKESYKLVFNGILHQFEINGDNNKEYLIKFHNLSHKCDSNENELIAELRKNSIKQIQIRFPDLKILILKGHSSHLSIYYRFLFMFVKFVHDEDEKIISYKEKRNYIKILRSQMSNSEQMLLFYNWISGYGKPWLNEQNKFLTDYRIIHNIYTDSLYPGINLNDIFDKYKYDMRTLHEKDYLFDEEA